MIEMVKGAFAWVVLTLIIAGIVWGVWRFAGDGVPITDPAWFGNAVNNFQELIDWSGDLGDEAVNQLPE